MTAPSDIRTLPHPTCRTCGSGGHSYAEGLSDRVYTVPGKWNLKECDNPECGSVWLDPCPVAADIPKLYENYFTHGEPAGKGKLARFSEWFYKVTTSALLARSASEGAQPATPTAPSLALRANNLFARFFLSIGPIRENVIAQSRWLHELPPGKLFDVGCGSGEFLQAMRDLGWQVSGLEPDDRAAEEARKKGFSVTTAAIEELNEPPGQYDVVTMVHVIEHLLDAKAVLKKLLALLKPGGLLMMVTPNVRSLSSKLFGPSWFGWEIPRHIHMYSPQSLLATIMEAGFSEARINTTSHSASGMWRLSRHIREHGSVPNMQAGFQPWLWFPSGYFQIREYLRCRHHLDGEELIAFARK
jgi:2-polyprenyl-3-methyl-5-hydroxy-6-metoxy-1,4-benzoquinol methylase